MNVHNELAHPTIIQGGMGIGVSGWILAHSVARSGQLGVVAGTALASVLVRRLQLGDPEGLIRSAMAAFPLPEKADQILARYFIPGGKAETAPYRGHSLPSLNPTAFDQALTVVANFVEVYLAKQGHSGRVGLNLLEKVQLSTLPSLYGAMLAKVDYILMGAGIPRMIPGVLDQFAAGEDASLPADLTGPKDSPPIHLEFSPRSFWDGEAPALPRPFFLGIVSSHTLAQTLARKSNGRIDGLVVEGPTAGGHNAPPRDKKTLTDDGEPVYGPRDVVDLQKIRDLELPFWLAGSYSRPGKLQEALQAGATGVQVGTPFAFCRESGMSAEIKTRSIQASRMGTLQVRTDPLASPTGFPLKILQLPGTIAEDKVFAERPRRCDLGYLRKPYRREDGSIGYRCPAEPEESFLRKGGTENYADRKCACNGLLATIGLGQYDREGQMEQPLVTAGMEACHLHEYACEGEDSYSAQQVLDKLLHPRREEDDGGDSRSDEELSPSRGGECAVGERSFR